MPHTYEIPTSYIARVNLAVAPSELTDSSLHIALSQTRNAIGQIELTDWLARPSKRALGRRVLEVTVFDNSGSEVFEVDNQRPSTRLRIPLGTMAVLGRSQSYGLPSLEAEPTSERHLFIGFAHTNDGELITVHDPLSTNGSHVISETELYDLQHHQDELTANEQSLADGVDPSHEWLYNGNIPRPEGGIMHMQRLHPGLVAGQKIRSAR